ncbi:hypothetical protein SDC9_60307 [bioreactor metagenome]|uniref:DUF6808 domain-containing protein n=1 Tax=bioreactor metagenome TaxID=1076179 RepID=A0A644XDH3_9ZZZZ
MISLDKIKKYGRIAGIMVVTILAIIGITSVGNCKRTTNNETDVIVLTDTLYIRDTIRIEKPVPKFIKRIDTLLVQTKDTIRLKDTLYLALPREQKTYRDKNYQAWISGYRPELDSIHIFRNTQQIITSTTIQTKHKSRRWGIGIQAGYGLTLQQNIIKPTPYIGVGLSYNLLRF